MNKHTLSSFLAATAMLFGSAAAQAEETITLKVGHFWPATAMSQKKVLEPWCDKIAAESGNRLKCQIFPGTQLGGTPGQLYQQVATAWPTSYGRCPAIPGGASRRWKCSTCPS